MTTSTPNQESPETLIEHWKKLGQLCFELVGMFEGIVLSLKNAGIAPPPDFAVNMRDAASKREAQLFSGASGVAGLGLGSKPRLARPPGYPTEEELVRKVEEKLREKSRRPADLADLLDVPKDFIEHVLTAYENLFTRSAERGWWGVRNK